MLFIGRVRQNVAPCQRRLRSCCCCVFKANSKIDLCLDHFNWVRKWGNISWSPRPGIQVSLLGSPRLTVCFSIRGTFRLFIWKSREEVEEDDAAPLRMRVHVSRRAHPILSTLKPIKRVRQYPFMWRGYLFFSGVRKGSFAKGSMVKSKQDC